MLANWRAKKETQELGEVWFGPRKNNISTIQFTHTFWNNATITAILSHTYNENIPSLKIRLSCLSMKLRRYIFDISQIQFARSYILRTN